MTTNPIPLAQVRAIKEEAEKTPYAECYVRDAVGYVSRTRTNVPALCDSIEVLVEVLRECQYPMSTLTHGKLIKLLSTIDPPRGEVQTEGEKP